MKTTNENTQFKHNLKPARLAFLAALMLITFVAAVIPAAAQESPRSLKSAQTAEAVPAKGSSDSASPSLAAGYCTYTINGTYNLFCTWSRINANSHVVAAISEYANGDPADRFIGDAQMTVHNIAPYNGGVEVQVDVNWGSPLNVRLDLLVD